MNLPRLPIGDTVSDGVDWIKANLQWVLDIVIAVLGFCYELVVSVLLFPPALVSVAILALIALAARSWQFGLFTLLSMLLVVSMEFWAPAMQTLALVLVATLIIILVGIPVGILAARNAAVSTVVRPVLDFMQTMPAFVYLVPVVIFFSIGAVPGMVATVIFALPPAVRLTELGIRQVDKETVEAGQAFGGTPWQILRGIQLPLGLPTIMAGVNQVIMLALSMAVIAGMMNSPGLGQEVVRAISQINVSLGFEAGLSVVILAIYLDRLTGSIGQSNGRSLGALLRNRRQAARAVQAEANSANDGAAAAKNEADIRVAAGPQKKF